LDKLSATLRTLNFSAFFTLRCQGVGVCLCVDHLTIASLFERTAMGDMGAPSMTFKLHIPVVAFYFTWNRMTESSVLLPSS
jgi:hypothetical protein